MIIKIEDAPHIKHIKIDINFDDDDTPNVNIKKTSEFPKNDTISNLASISGNDYTTSHYENKDTDIALNTDESFDISDEVVKKPEIPDTIREAKVSTDMENLEL